MLIPTKFAKTNTLIEQWMHVRSENREELNAFHDYPENPTEENLEHLIEELVDGQMTRETMLACLGLGAKQRRRARLKVIYKNCRRNYYD